MQSPDTLIESKDEEHKLLVRADNLNDFGTLTSLGASALYFAEKAMNKEITKTMNTVSLVAIAVGMGAVITSFAMRHQASSLRLSNASWAARQAQANAECKGAQKT